MPDINHVDSCPHTAVDNTLVIRMVCARSDGVLSGSWVHVPRPPRFCCALDFPHGYRDMTFALFALHPRNSESNLLMFLIAPLPGLSLPQDGAECLFAWFHIVTARSTIVAYRYLGQTCEDTQDVSPWLWLSLPLHGYGISRHRANAQCFVLILKDSSGDLCRLVTPYKFLLLLCKVVYRTEIVKASRAASR